MDFRNACVVIFHSFPFVVAAVISLGYAHNAGCTDTVTLPIRGLWFSPGSCIGRCSIMTLEQLQRDVPRPFARASTIGGIGRGQLTLT